jgi:hypothetical protein
VVVDQKAQAAMTIGAGIAIVGMCWAFVGFFKTVSHHKLRLSELLLEARKNGLDATVER